VKLNAALRMGTILASDSVRFETSVDLTGIGVCVAGAVEQPVNNVASIKLKRQNKNVLCEEFMDDRNTLQ
jgi:hypothetical protein